MEHAWAYLTVLKKTFQSVSSSVNARERATVSSTTGRWRVLHASRRPCAKPSVQSS
jgi:hypothetical protein